MTSARGVTSAPRSARGRTGRLPLISLTLLALLSGAAALAGPAAAHDSIDGTTPADGATVAVAPDSVTLLLSEPPQALGTEVSVAGPDGAVVSTGAIELTDTTVVEHLVADRPAGTYTVQWRVTSADGHPISGSFVFTATASASAASVPTPSAIVSPTESTTLGSSDPAPTSTIGPGGTTSRSPGIDPALGVVALAVLLGGAVAGVLLVRRRRHP